MRESPRSCYISTAKVDREDDMHTDDCYTWEEVLTCEIPVGEGAHHHSEECYETQRVLSCGKEEGEGAHTHDDTCYEIQKVLICDKEEVKTEHVHTVDCFQVVDMTPEEIQKAKELEIELELSLCKARKCGKELFVALHSRARRGFRLTFLFFFSADELRFFSFGGVGWVRVFHYNDTMPLSQSVVDLFNFQSSLVYALFQIRCIVDLAVAIC